MGFFLVFRGLIFFFLYGILMVLVVLSTRRCPMAYFLKQTKLKNRTYLAIYESFYNHDRKGTAHRCYKSLGSIETHKANGLEDPVSFFQQEVDELNSRRAETSVPKISDRSPMVHFGYFPFQCIMERLQISRFLNVFQLTNDFRFDLSEVLSTLVYARAVDPCSKRRTYNEVMPNLLSLKSYSYDQMLDGLSFLGLNYEKMVELFTQQTKLFYGLDTTRTYFDCTNFYFEIDREDDFRRKGPSKENRKDPIVGMGLLLDRNLIPVGMSMFPGNQSEKPVLPQVVSALKRRHDVTGRTIHVADKGLNCAENIVKTLGNKDGYLFSKSVKGLPEKERLWVFMEDGFEDVRDKDGTVLYTHKSCIDEFPYTVESEGKKVTVNLKEKRLVTYNPKLARKQRAEIGRMVEKAISMSSYETKRSEYGESAKYMSFVDTDGRKAEVKLNQAAIDKDMRCAGYNMLVTSEISMSDKDMYETYHNLWRIEESFRIMKSDLDARPVFLQTEETIKGHFLICYITVLLERILQFHILRERFSTSQIFEMVRKLKAVKVDGRYINTASDSEIIRFMAETYNIPVNHLSLSETQLKGIFNTELKPLKP